MRIRLLLGAFVLLLMGAAAGQTHGGLRFIPDDYPKALAEAKQRKLPVFVECWAPW